MKLSLLVILFAEVFCQAEVAIKCSSPKYIPDADKAPLIYYSPDPKQCDKFHACSFTSQEATTSFLCEDGLVFDGYRCILPHGVDCKGRELLQPPISSNQCLRQNGIYKAGDACNQYILCSRGVATPYTCAGNLIFDESKGVCAHPDQVELKSPECSEAIRYDFTCPVKAGHYIHRSPRDCRAFFTCAFPHYRPHLGGCPYGKVFNEKIQRCDVPANVEGCERYYEEN